MMRAGSQQDRAAQERWRAIVRLALGTLQIFGASFSVVLLFLTGVNPWSLSAVVLTCAFTTVSVLIFGDRGRRRGHARGGGN